MASFSRSSIVNNLTSNSKHLHIDFDSHRAQLTISKLSLQTMLLFEASSQPQPNRGLSRVLFRTDQSSRFSCAESKWPSVLGEMKIRPASEHTYICILMLRFYTFYARAWDPIDRSVALPAAQPGCGDVAESDGGGEIHGQGDVDTSLSFIRMMPSPWPNPWLRML